MKMIERNVKRNALVSLLIGGIMLGYGSAGCGGDDDPVNPGEPNGVTTDAQLFTLITETEPFGDYELFPNADSVAAGTLDGSEAHRPLVRVSLNSTAQSALVDGRLPEGGSFPDGSIVFKRVTFSDRPTVYAVMYKDRDNPLSGRGWLWAEFEEDASVIYSIGLKGPGCVNCHVRQDGPSNDLVRTFERQR